jgi:hypothetical protein
VASAIDRILGAQESSLTLSLQEFGQLASHWQNMDLDSFADSAHLQVQSKTGTEDVKPVLTRDEFFYFDTLVFQVIFAIRV